MALVTYKLIFDNDQEYCILSDKNISGLFSQISPRLFRRDYVTLKYKSIEININKSRLFSIQRIGLDVASNSNKIWTLD